MYVYVYICIYKYVHITGSSLLLQTSTSAFFTKKTLQVQHPDRATNLKAANRIGKIIAQISLSFTEKAICRGTGQKEMQPAACTN